MIIERCEHAVVGSRAIAERFKKNHRDVLKSIRELDEGVRKSSHTPETGIMEDQAFQSKYFIRSSYVNNQNGQNYPEYLCTRDGFSLLAMGFTGSKALAWKIKYIDAFDLMESAIRERKSSEWLITRRQGKLVRREEADTIAQLIKYAEAQGSKSMRKQAYTVYTKLVNSLVGIQAGQRGEASFKTLSTIAFLEDMILHTISEDMAKGVYYKEVYQHCKANGEQIIRFAYLPRIA